MALAAEAGELLEVFQWKTTDEVRHELAGDGIAAAAEELADILIFLVRLADVLDIDLEKGARSARTGLQRLGSSQERWSAASGSV
jgi:NTP pyrophosphatase (non-canonical NTP hydrolase)